MLSRFEARVSLGASGHAPCADVSCVARRVPKRSTLGLTAQRLTAREACEAWRIGSTARATTRRRLERQRHRRGAHRREVHRREVHRQNGVGGGVR